MALVTGASSGIGRAIAERYAAEGAHVAVNYLPRGRNEEEEARAVAGSLATPGMTFGADVTRRPEVEGMVAGVVEKFGRLDIATCNAGIEIKRPFLERRSCEPPTGGRPLRPWRTSTLLTREPPPPLLKRKSYLLVVSRDA